MLISKLFISLALSMGLIPATEARLKYVGINVSSGEFGVYSPGNPGFGLPGRFPDDYQFINKSAIDVQISQGINLFRLSFLVERMCPPSYGLGPKFNETVSVLGRSTGVANSRRSYV
jgi:endoglucanase